MSVTITVNAALVAALADSGGGDNANSTIEVVVGSNSVHEIAGVFYVVVLTAANKFQMYSSSDSGATWATVGLAFTPSVYGGGMNSFVVGTKIWVAYSKSVHLGSDKYLDLNYFETAGSTWGTELVFDCGTGDHFPTPMKVEGPYTTHIRLDGSFVFTISDSVTAYQWVVTYDGVSFNGPFQLSTTIQIFESSIMDTTGDVHVFYGSGYDPGVFYHQVFTTLDVVNAAVLISYTGAEILSWSDIGLEYGYVKAGTFYLAVGIKTAAYPTIFGQPAIFYGNDGAWTMGALIDTDVAIADYSVYFCALALINGTLVYYWRGIDSAGANYIDRVGYAPEGSHNTPADWTWQTVYDLSSPSPAVSGQATPYDTVGSPTKGATTGLIQSGDNLRMVTTLKNNGGALFVTYLFLVVAAGVVEEISNSFE
jgi:hypothetical protein